MQTKDPIGITDSFQKLCHIIVRLRGPGGCSWDIEQTPRTLRDDLIEETYECIEAIDEQEPVHIKEELGDLFLLITMLAYMHEQEGVFSIADALDTVSEKLVRRHPHVFGAGDGKISVKNTREVLDNWAKIKIEQEGRKPKDSILDEVHRGLPPLDRAFELQKKAAKVGFDWPEAAGVITKIKEEMGEVEAVMAEATAGGKADGFADIALEGELGDLLFSVINLCRFTGTNPSVALQHTNSKFTKRFKYVEKSMKESNQEMKIENLDIMDRYWNEAKGRD